MQSFFRRVTVSVFSVASQTAAIDVTSSSGRCVRRSHRAGSNTVVMRSRAR